MNTEIDDVMIDELRDGFAPAGYERTTRSFRSPSRAPYFAGLAVLAAVAATVTLVCAFATPIENARPQASANAFASFMKSSRAALDLGAASCTI